MDITYIPVISGAIGAAASQSSAVPSGLGDGRLDSARTMQNVCAQVSSGD